MTIKFFADRINDCIDPFAYGIDDAIGHFSIERLPVL
jgi:hypothetical protein